MKDNRFSIIKLINHDHGQGAICLHSNAKATFDRVKDEINLYCHIHRWVLDDCEIVRGVGAIGCFFASEGARKPRCFIHIQHDIPRFFSIALFAFLNIEEAWKKKKRRVKVSIKTKNKKPHYIII